MEHELRTPVPRAAVERLEAGDTAYITGTILTARDKAHLRMAEYLAAGRPLPFDLDGAVIFHGAPIVKEKASGWDIVAIGPTTSARMNAQEPQVIARGVRLIVGKGGMDQAVLKALHDHGCAYLSMTGGAAVLGARKVRQVVGVEWADLGLAEAVWALEVSRLGPLTVTMDAHMRDLYADVRARVAENIKAKRFNR